jgi:hypothetical protein
MITDQDVIQLFGKLADISPGTAVDSQVFVGENSFPTGCSRHLEMFDKSNIIPKYCFDCFKVLVSPRNVMELFKLLMIFERIPLPNDNRRKCMIELREKIPGNYKGYIYCNSLDEGNEVFKIARKAVSQDLSPQVDVSLKRGCSEYALVYPAYAVTKPASALMRYRKDWQALEDSLAMDTAVIPRQAHDTDGHVPPVRADGPKRYTLRDALSMQYWLCYAATIGDASYLSISGKTMPTIPNLKRAPFRNTIPFSKR